MHAFEVRVRVRVRLNVTFSTLLLYLQEVLIQLHWINYEFSLVIATADIL